MVNLIQIYLIYFHGQPYSNLIYFHGQPYSNLFILFPWSALFKFIYFIFMVSLIQIYLFYFHDQFYLNLFPW